MSDKFSIRGMDPEGVADGDYVVSVAGGHVTGLSPASPGGGSGVVETIVPGTGIAVDDTDPANPVVSASGGGSGGDIRPLSLPQGALQRKYEFTSDTESWTASGGTLAHDAAGGRLAHTAGSTNATIVLLEPSSATNVADGELVADFSEETLSSTYLETGLFFRASDANNFYMLTLAMGSVAGAHVALWKRALGTYTSLGESQGNANAMPIRWPVVGRQNMRMMVRFVGGHIRAYFNETFVGAWNDTTFTSGRVGLRHLARASSSQVAYYDNVAVYSLPPDWAPPAYD